MEVMEEGNLMDRVPILLDRDFEYYQKHQTVLSETICIGVVGGRLDFPKSASFASVKLVQWWEEEFYAAFRCDSCLFNNKDDEKNTNVKTSDPEKFFTVVGKSSDLLLEHLDMLAQEALDHADLSVLTATLGAAALIKNSLHCYIQSSQNAGVDNITLLQNTYRKFTSMSEAVGERLLDLHVRLLSLYLLQDSGGRLTENSTSKLIDCSSPSIHGWWLYMQGTKQDLWQTVPPKMAQRIFAGMLNESLSILSVRYCQTVTNEANSTLFLNDIVNILMCTSELLPCICACAMDLLGLDEANMSHDVRDIHAKCMDLFRCLVFRGADLHHIYKENTNDMNALAIHEMSHKISLGLELEVLLSQPQPSWELLVKVLMMRDCILTSLLMNEAIKQMFKDNQEWPGNGLWLSINGNTNKCDGFLCTKDGFCGGHIKSECVDYAMVVGALTYILISVGPKNKIKPILMTALESCGGNQWANCLDRRSVWCRRKPSWLVALLAQAPDIMPSVATTLVKAVQTGASMYQTMSLCLQALFKLVDVLPECLLHSVSVIQDCMPVDITPIGHCLLLHVMIMLLYQTLDDEAKISIENEKAELAKRNGILTYNSEVNTHPLASSEYNLCSKSSIQLAIAENLCCIDEDNKHTELIDLFRQPIGEKNTPLKQFGFEEFNYYIQDRELCLNAERITDASVMTSSLLTKAVGKDSLRVIYKYVKMKGECLIDRLGLKDSGYTKDDDKISLEKTPLLYIMFHIGRRPFDQYLNGLFHLHWSKLIEMAKCCHAIAKPHILRRFDFRNTTNKNKTINTMISELKDVFNKKNQDLL